MAKVRRFFKSVAFSVRLYCRSSGVLVFVYLLLALLGSSVGLFGTYSLKHVLDSLTGDVDTAKLILWVALYVGALVLTQAENSLQSIVEDTVTQKARHLYECEVAERLVSLPMSVIDSSEGRDIIDVVNYSWYYVVDPMKMLVITITNAYKFIVAFVFLVKFNLWFSLLFIALSIPGSILNEFFDHKDEQLRQESAPDIRKFCYYRWMLTDSWPAKDVRMYDLTESIKARYDDEKREYVTANKKLDKKRLFSILLAEFVYRSGEIMLTVFVIAKAISGEISIGDVAMYIGFAVTAGDAFRNTLFNSTWAWSLLAEETESLFKFWAITETKTFGTKKLESFETLTFDNVYFKYPRTEKYVLSGVSFTLNRGDRLSIVGINGAGKSTIIKLMLGLYEIESGQILINGYPMTEYDINSVRRIFSALFQSFVQYPLTLRENIALSDYCRVKKDEEIEASLRKSGVYEELQDKLEKGLDSYMTRRFDDRGTELSRGQWQKIALSRAYFKNADIFIFDEPSAALDAEAEDRIFKNFEAISKGKTGIMISHRISSARMANKVIVLEAGKITESGTHDELVALGGLYAKLYNLQKEKYALEEVAQ